MAIIESKNVDLVVNKDNVVDLYDEQIISNKTKSINNEKILNNLVGRMVGVESYTYNFTQRIENLENNIVTQNDINKVKQEINNISKNYSTIINTVNKIDTEGIKSDILNNKNLIKSLNERTTYINNQVIQNTNDIDVLKNNHIILNNKVNNLEQNINAVSNEVNNLSDTTNSNIINLNNAITSLTNQNQTITQQITQLQQTSSATYDGRIRNIELANKNLTQKVNTFDNRITLNKTEIDNINNRINNIKGLPTLQNDLNKYLRSDGEWSTINTDTYTKEQVDVKVNSKADKSHGNHVPELENNNAKFLRSDNTWQTVNVGNLNVYSKEEINTIIRNSNNYVYKRSESDERYVNKSGDTMSGELSFANNSGSVVGKVYNDNSYWKICGNDSDRPSTSYDIYGNGSNAEKAVICVRRFLNGNLTENITLINEVGNATFPKGLYANRIGVDVNNCLFSVGKNSGDAIINNGANINICSWYGLGFFNTFNNQYTGTMNLRNGDWRTIGAMSANTFYANNWFRCYDNCGIHWEKWGGGWYMQDSDWIRAHGNKNIYTAGKMKADGGFEGKASSAGWADGAAYSDRSIRVENDYRNMRFHWSGQGGQPTWLWGGNDGENMYVWNPSNFNVASATRINNNKLIFNNGTELWIE